MWNIFKLLSYSCCWKRAEKSRQQIGTVLSHPGQLANEVYLSSYTQRDYLVFKRLVNGTQAAIHMQNTTVQKMAFFTPSNEFPFKSHVNSNQIFCYSVPHGCIFGWYGNLLEGIVHFIYSIVFTTQIVAYILLLSFLVRHSTNLKLPAIHW